ncbi:MAG: 16S rRNA (uracil(1498)-N(3))-methyltransferase [Myxococcales bacterium]
MIRLPIPQERIASRVALDRAERHYLIDVLRLQPGATFEVFDGKGGRYPATLGADDSLALGPRQDEAAAGRTLVLAQALAKGEKMDLIVQKATELGASEVAPFAASRCVVKLEGKKAEERVARWQRIAEEASRQCGRADVPRVRPLEGFAALLERAKADGAQVLVLFEQEKALRLSCALARSAGPVVVAVGPEGGFTEDEVAFGQAQGAQAVTLGRLILRTETAGLAALAVARFLDGELG